MARLKADKLYGNRWKIALRHATRVAEQAARDRAPVDSGRLRASISSTMDPSPMPLYGKVTANATNGGYRYGWALQSSQKVRYRYRQGAFAGKLTRRWFTGALKGLRKQLAEVLRGMRNDIEAEWRR